MKNLLFVLLISVHLPLLAQENQPQKLVEDFFTAFHAKDTLGLKELCHSEIILQTIYYNIIKTFNLKLYRCS